MVARVVGSRLSRMTEPPGRQARWWTTSVDFSRSIAASSWFSSFPNFSARVVRSRKARGGRFGDASPPRAAGSDDRRPPPARSAGRHLQI